MQFDILTIFPEVFENYFKTSIIVRAQKSGLVKINTHDLRKWTEDKHKSIDDKPYGGGPGMIFKIEPIYKALKDLNKNIPKKFQSQSKIRCKMQQKIVLLTPQGKQFTQKKAKQFSKQDRIILIAGHYEGFDKRINKFIDEKISVGPYVLTGGELPAMTIVDATTRLIPKVIRPESLKEESFSSKALISIEYPQYTRPRVFTYQDKSGRILKLKVPNILTSGNHSEIEKWKQKHKRSLK